MTHAQRHRMRWGARHLLLLALIAVSVGAAAPASAADAARQQPASAAGVARQQPASAAAAARQSAVRQSLAQGNYLIGADDVLDIVVWDNTAMSRTVPVRPDGMISLPLLNDVPVAGLTAMQVRTVLMSRMAQYMPEPEVSVIVKEVKSAKVSVVGEVKTPGRYDIKTRATILDILAQAGPFSDFASRGRIFVLRSDGQNTKRLSFDYNKALSPHGEQENFVLQPGDIIVVP